MARPLLGSANDRILDVVQSSSRKKIKKIKVEMRGIDPRTSRMLSERSTI
ncbi:Hypothetical predicted protein [Prunus dulcis]|uniref:Uncharacterized protein n=1 Tax=Prunus dulcis TaxID=3755 RepID=A0A5E4G8L8_PRUDU|nr:Hypothetical predicted protein [Prunus dulcis]